ncbi:hypothetical protein CEXT_527411 [Caerostris extrusa]|uniref:Uncharacterized protein n=1 Tax=Caerostris extrusa TaxID=172846 RepID=A0AAV4XAU9_CAEEX|nr:hypothetical protein CEXT_527411 [Caerostris extrusa]
MRDFCLVHQAPRPLLRRSLNQNQRSSKVQGYFRYESIFPLKPRGLPGAILWTFGKEPILEPLKPRLIILPYKIIKIYSRDLFCIRPSGRSGSRSGYLRLKTGKGWRDKSELTWAKTFFT